jgi:hypothetical protein
MSIFGNPEGKEDGYGLFVALVAGIHAYRRDV